MTESDILAPPGFCRTRSIGPRNPGAGRGGGDCDADREAVRGGDQHVSGAWTGWVSGVGPVWAPAAAQGDLAHQVL